MSADEFYLQDNRSYVGNDMLFWAKDSNGYTTDISKAEVYTKAKAMAKHQSRISDIPWPKAYIDAKTRPAVDMQYVKRAEALAGTGIVLIEPRWYKRQTERCWRCGVFISREQVMLQAKPGGDRRKTVAPIGFSERRQQDRRAMQRANMLRMQSEDD